MERGGGEAQKSQAVEENGKAEEQLRNAAVKQGIDSQRKSQAERRRRADEDCSGEGAK